MDTTLADKRRFSCRTHRNHANFHAQAALQRAAGRLRRSRMFNGRTAMKTATRLSVLATATLIATAGSALAQQQPPQAPNMTFFVTSVGPGKGANLGGLDGADAYCQRLATAAGAGSKTWRAYLSTNAGGGSINARDRIGRGPWQNFKGEVVAQNVDDLHSANNKLGPQTTLTERGQMVAGFGMNPNWHDVLTGSQMDGRAWPGNFN